MTPIEQMAAAAKRYPRLTHKLAALPREDQEFHIELLKKQLTYAELDRELTDMCLIQGHLEIQSLSRLLV